MMTMNNFIKVTVSSDKKLVELESFAGSDVNVTVGDVNMSPEVKKFRRRNGILYVPTDTSELSYSDRIFVFTDNGTMEQCLRSIRDMAKVAGCTYTELWS